MNHAFAPAYRLAEIVPSSRFINLLRGFALACFLLLGLASQAQAALSFAAAVNYGVGTNPQSVATGDFNGDGKADLAVANVADNNVSVLLGNGDGSFAVAVNYGAGTNPWSVATGDFNGDGKADLAVANFNGNNVSVLLGNGDGSFQVAVNYAVGTPRSVAVGDFNGDGKNDLAVTHFRGDNISVLLGNGDGSFQVAVNYAVGVTPYSVAVGDFNGDGKNDLAVAKADINDVSILLNMTPSANSNLSNLALSSGTLTPAFASGTTSYTASVGNGVTAITVTPTVADGTATVTVNGGSAATPVNLSVGSNTITVLVTAQDTSTKTYTVTVTRAASSNADMSALALSTGTLNPAFASGTTSYSASVGNGVTAITVTPTVADGTATITVNGGSAATPVNLSVGSNTITVLVTAQDTSTKTYTVTVTRAAAPAAPATPPPPAPSGPSVPPLSPTIPGVNSMPPILNMNGGDGPGFLGDLTRILSGAVGASLTHINQSPSGTVVMGGFNGGNLAFVPLSFQTGDTRPDGVYPLGNGQYQIVSNGTAITVAPALVNLDQLTGLLPGGTVAGMASNGVLSATLDGITYVVQPGIVVQLVENPGGHPQLVMGGDGYLHFTDSAGNRQVLYPAFLEPDTLSNDLHMIGTTLTIQLDGTALIQLNGINYILMPDLTLGSVPPEHGGDSWWQEGPDRYRFRHQQHFNSSQGFTVRY